VRRKYRHLDNVIWESLGSDEWAEHIENESLRRQRSGETKRELAQKAIVKGPAVLEAIMTDPATHAKHKIDSIKAMD
jgi:hypothetical protein